MVTLWYLLKAALGNNLKGTPKGQKLVRCTGGNKRHHTLTQHGEGGLFAGNRSEGVGNATLILARGLATHFL